MFFEEMCFSTPNLINFAKFGGGWGGMANFLYQKLEKKKERKHWLKVPIITRVELWACRMG
jgi:hypothetical protein